MYRTHGSRVSRAIFFLALMLLALTGGWFFGIKTQESQIVFRSNFLSPQLSKEALLAKITRANVPEVYKFKQTEVNLDGLKEAITLDFSYDPVIQTAAENLVERYHPDLAAVVALDASTGRVLAMVGEDRVFRTSGHPAISVSYPAASVFKVITATAALENQKILPSSLLPFAGRGTTLYRSQVLHEKVTGWKRICTLKEAFSKSLNPVFGRLGVFLLGKGPMQNCSNRFWFNGSIPAEFPIAESRSANPSDSYELAEMASGFTQENIMTPLHGALIAASVANGGVMMEPYFLNAAYLKSGKAIYRSEPAILSRVMSSVTAEQLKSLMRETVISGTSKKSFRGFFKGKFSRLDVGGKTGHITDRNLGGRMDWFVGFAQSRGRKIAISVLTMHKKYWTIKSSDLARRTIEKAFQDDAIASARPAITNPRKP